MAAIGKSTNTRPVQTHAHKHDQTGNSHKQKLNRKHTNTIRNTKLEPWLQTAQCPKANWMKSLFPYLDRFGHGALATPDVRASMASQSAPRANAVRTLTLWPCHWHRSETWHAVELDPGRVGFGRRFLTSRAASFPWVKS